MFLLNLTWLQFAGILAGVSAGMVALYLWDRARRRLTVATLRFWTEAARNVEVQRRLRIRQPLSLALQLASVALLLLALAQPRWGSPVAPARDHVLILDTSAWMGARSAQGTTLMEEARAAASAYAHAAPGQDRIMLVRADALATPATAFESNRQALERAIERSAPGVTALNLAQALEFARRVQRQESGPRGEIVYVGAGRMVDNPAELAGQSAQNLRVIAVGDPADNCGLKRVGLQRSAADPDVWEVLAGVRNYGSKPHATTLALAFAGAPVGAQQIALGPGAERSLAFSFRARGPGRLEARLLPPDAFPANDRAVLEIPGRRPVRVAVYSEEPELLRAALAASSEVEAEFYRPSEFRGASGAGIFVFDRFNPPQRPAADSIFIEPPPQGAPVRVRTAMQNVALARWRPDHPVGAGLRTKDLRLEAVEVFDLGPDDSAIAEADAGPVIVARAGKPKLVALGFHPVRSAMRYELAAPLLFANILHWMAPDAFLQRELNAESTGIVNVDLGAAPEGEVRVQGADGRPLPFTQEGRTVRFFAGAPGTVRVLTNDRELDYSLTLPELAENRWTPPRSAAHGVPRPSVLAIPYADLWPWLALAGTLGLIAEWWLFGRRRLEAGRAA